MKIEVKVLSAALLIYPGLIFAQDAESPLENAAQMSAFAETSPDAESARTFAAGALEKTALAAPAPVSAGAPSGSGVQANISATSLSVSKKTAIKALGAEKTSRMSSSSDANEYGLAGKMWNKLGDGFNFLFGKPKPERIRGVELLNKYPDSYLYGAGVSVLGLGMGGAILAAGVTGFGAVIGAGLAGIGLLFAGAMLYDFCFGVARN